jgi:uncharacterized protein YxeA
MVKIFSISVLQSPPSGAATLLSNANDLSSFSFYQKGSVGEFMNFFSKTVAERTPQGQRQSVQENNYTAHVYNRGGSEQLVGESLSHPQKQAANLPPLSGNHHGPGVPCPARILIAGEASG